MKDAFNQTHSFIAAFVLVALVGAAVVLTFVSAPEGSRDVIAMIVGALVGGFGQIIKHYFDGSKSEQRREEIRAEETEAVNKDKPK